MITQKSLIKKIINKLIKKQSSFIKINYLKPIKVN